MSAQTTGNPSGEVEETKKRSCVYPRALSEMDNILIATRLPVNPEGAMSFGHTLRRSREARGLSLRELAKLCDVDHAYIHRLERDEKTAPSEQVVASLVRTLKLTPRRAELLRMLVGKTVSPTLVDVFLEDEGRPLDLLEPAYQMSFRGKRPETESDWRAHIDRLARFFSEDAE